MIEAKEEKKSSPRTNMAYLLGYIATLLIGSIHFGTFRSQLKIKVTILASSELAQTCS